MMRSRLRAVMRSSRPQEGTVRQSVVIFTEIICAPSSSSSACVTASVTSVVLRLLSSGPVAVLGRSDNNRASRIGMLRQRRLWMMRMVVVVVIGVMVQSFVHDA